MDRFGTSNDHQPLTWVNGYPIYGAQFVVLVFVVSMLVTTVMMAFEVTHLLGWITFTSEAVLSGQVWRVFTYGLVNPPDLWFAVDMVLLFWFGREVERYLGRPRFLLLFGCLYLLSPALFTVVGIWRPMSIEGQTGAFAIFIAFATIYPGAAIFFGLLAKWVAWILVSIYALVALSNRDLVGLLSLGATVGFAFAFVRHEQGRFTLPLPRLPRRMRAAVSRPAPSAAKWKPGEIPKDDAEMEMDALLDKIARSGIESLTPVERQRLDTARAQMLKRKSRRG